MAKSQFLVNDLANYASNLTISDDMVGVISQDRTAVVGKNNWCFIYEGSNDYRNSYINKSLQTLGDNWSHIIEQRQYMWDDLGIQFLQVIVPNKFTLIPEYFPEVLNVDISYPLIGIMKACVNANMLIPVTELRADSIREAVFRRNDSHLTIAGNAYLTEMILTKLGLNNFSTEFIETHQTMHVGDLGCKFKQAMPEQLYAPIWSKGLFDQQCIKKIKENKSKSLNGIEQHFVNPNAPIKKKIMVIGNSFFERVPSWGLSPFFSSLFSEYFFSWMPNIDTTSIGEFAPDIVIAQTCERFLSRLPVDLHKSHA